MHSIHDFYQFKQQHEKISMISCYDYPSAKIASQANIDCLLVGDSVAMVVHGHHNTLAATIEMMVLHTAAVANGAKDTFIVADLPFMSYRKSLSESMQAIEQLMRAGASAIKLEGVTGNLELIEHTVASGVPVMGHIGLTPQHIFGLGGFKVQGRSQNAKNQLLKQAKQLEAAGCFAIVLECVPAELAEEITKAIGIATIGIGAGANTDGQVLVWHDLLGLQQEFLPRFVKQFCQAQPLLQQAITDYHTAVKAKTFPAREHIY